jgi:mannose-1-phosphate guanylyltransferase
MRAEVWTIVLAAGAGRRLASLTGGVPKQYWRPQGGSSLLEETVARLQPFSPPERTVTVVSETHREYLRSHAPRWSIGEVMYQPMDRGTAVGVLLPLVAVASAAPNAIVVITPSDHGVEDEALFGQGIRRAIDRVESGKGQVVLFGVEPSAVSEEFGWITPAERGPAASDGFQRVASFVEKPPLLEAFRLFSSGAVWNTMVLVARAKALLALCRQHLPFHYDTILAALRVDGSAQEPFLREWYPELPVSDFCRDVLTPSAGLCLYTWPTEMGWSDLGTPDRMTEWLALHTQRTGAGALEKTLIEHVA